MRVLVKYGTDMVAVKARSWVQSWLLWAGFEEVTCHVLCLSTADYTVVVCRALVKQMQQMIGCRTHTLTANRWMTATILQVFSS